MVSEACATAAPVYVAEPGRATGRVRVYLDEMLRRGRIRALASHAEAFAAEPLRETPRIAALVRERLAPD
jgi:mitochondrial fission protein ELM1